MGDDHGDPPDNDDPRDIRPTSKPDSEGSSKSTTADHDASSPATGAKDDELAEVRKSRIDRDAEAKARDHQQRGEYATTLAILMKAYGRPITAHIFRIVSNVEDAKDVRQTVFLQAFQGLPTFGHRSSYYTWLTQIAIHRSLDAIKRERTRATTDDFDVLNALHWQPNAAMDALAVAKWRALEDCLSKLPADVRSMVLMRFSAGFSCVEIATFFEKLPGTISIRIARALAKLLDCLRRKRFCR